MAKLYGHAANTIVPQDDFSATQSENGGYEASQSFRIRKRDIDSSGVASRFPKGALLSNLDPNCDRLFAFLRLSRIKSVQNVAGGWQLITAGFVGFAGDQATNEETQVSQPTYSKRGTLVDMPLDEHPKWKALTSDQKFGLGLLIKGDAVSSPNFTKVGSYNEDGKWYAWENDSGEIVLSGDALEFATRIAQGRTTYRMATYEYHHRWQSNRGLSAAQMNDLGKISTPDGAPPTPGGGRDWLLVSVDEEQTGSGDFLFDNALSYLLSDKGGHDDFLQS